ncbi:MAG: hypothetical protein AMXMBFR77_27720 [Phycisphaerales bacterium]
MRLRLAELRKRQGWTQEDLARATGFDRSTVGRHESALRGWDTTTLQRYANALGVEPWELLGYPWPPMDDLDPDTVAAVRVLLALPKDLRQMARRLLEALRAQ